MDSAGPVCLIIMDGFGLSKADEGNAISQADTPCLDSLFEKHSMARLRASGEAVGLPDGQMGNSEVGHLNIGAGRVVRQELMRINQACRDGSIAHNDVIKAAFDVAKCPGSVLHIMGLLSDGGVHSSNQHLYVLLANALNRGVPKIHLHCFMDGRDVAPTSGIGFIQELEDVISTLQNSTTEIQIASVIGRYYAMDRDNRWDRVEKAYRTLTLADPITDTSPQTMMENSYKSGVTDEFIEPIAFDERGMKDGDSVIFFNFRPDRAREITRALVDYDFTPFLREAHPALHLVCLTEYDPTIKAPVAFKKDFPQNTLADVISQAGLRQYHIAETEKYAHVTFFLNGGIEQAKKGEQRVLIPSPNVATYDLQPEMSAREVAYTLSKAIDEDQADVYIVNLANCDMVGHTGDMTAAVAAVEAVDRAVGKVLLSLKKKRGSALLTADHGNADKMINKNEPFTAHTMALVPLVLIDYSGRDLNLDDREGSLSNIAPTLLDMIGIPIPSEMTAQSLLAKKLQGKL